MVGQLNKPPLEEILIRIGARGESILFCFNIMWGYVKQDQFQENCKNWSLNPSFCFIVAKKDVMVIVSFTAQTTHERRHYSRNTKIGWMEVRAILRVAYSNQKLQ